MQIFTPLIVGIEILRSLSRSDRMAFWVWYDFRRNEHEGANTTETSSTSSNSSTMCRSQKPCTGFCTTPSEHGGPESKPPPRPPPTRYCSRQKLYYAAQANMTPGT